MWRFIAGAKCPKCGVVDRLQILHEEEQYLCRCINCDYQAQLNENADLSSLNQGQIPLTNLNGE